MINGLFEKRTDEAGFTLVEVLVAIVILSTALLAMAGLLTTTIKSTSYGENITIANNLAQEKIEDIRMISMTAFDGVVDSVLSSDPVTGANPDAVEDYGSIAGYSSFRREVYISNGASPVNAKDVAVVVVWTDGLGSHSTMLRTTLAR